jgi:hypothetical protein
VSASETLSERSERRTLKLSASGSIAVSVSDLVEFIRKQGMVLESAKGPIPNLASRIAGSPVTGNWWGHPHAHAIFNALQEVRASPDILACRLVNGKVTLVHRRLWPVLLRLQSRIAASRIAAIEERHTPGGKHVVTQVPLAEWVGDDVKSKAARLPADEALRTLEAIAPARFMLDA